ncbi:ribosome recycling factor family protein [Vibrio maritimus]|uniref:ribosome recycling factor family protein n=1 Tax=Vibrio maritimus TaxID=990268 RepID=UPI00406827D5
MEKSRFLITIRLNSFVHRVEDKSAVLACAVDSGCTLKRIRRSRNWTLSGEATQLTKFALEANVGWISVAVDKALEGYKSPIQEVLEKDPEITVADLMFQSGCTLAEARAAIDEFEDL